MKNLIIYSLLLVVAAACGNKTAEQETIELKSFKDKLSYTLGADHARAISESGDPNFDKYDVDEILKGFREGLKNDKAFDQDCKSTMSSLFGQSGQEFNQKYAKQGSNCIGKISGIFFASGWKQKKAMSKIDMQKVLIGFEHGLRKADTLVPRTEQATMIQEFMADLNKMNGAALMEKAMNKKNVIVTQSGIVLETLKEGTGGKPAPGDDVLANYILMNSLGDTLQNSFEMAAKYNQPLKPFSLSEVVAGWQEGMPLMKKGGTYRLYIPFHLAWGEQGMFNPQTQSYEIQPYETVVFYIELLNYGKPGSLTKMK
ncbi:MAG: FKBP-type peptidyl-prolyl cis-trans isomerase [Bacteroidota bacterium]